VRELRQANNPNAGQPTSAADTELAVDPYFPSTIIALPVNLRGRAVHAGGRNFLALEGSARFVKDARTTRD
jgi:hypothetical protein